MREGNGFIMLFFCTFLRGRVVGKVEGQTDDVEAAKRLGMGRQVLLTLLKILRMDE